MEKNNKFSALFGQVWCLVASIIAFIVSVSTIVCCFLSIFTNLGFMGVIDILWNVFRIIWTVPIVLIGVGCLVLYIKGKSRQLSYTAVSMVKISIMIKGIATFVVVVGFDLLLLVGLIIFFASDPPILLVLLGLFLLGITTYYSVVILMYTLRMNNILGSISDCNSIEQTELKKTAVYLSVMLMAEKVFSFIVIMLGIVGEAFFIGQFCKMPEMYPFFDCFNNMFCIYSSSIAVKIFDLISVTGFIVLYIMSIVFSCRVKQFKTSPVYIEQTVKQTEVEFGMCEGKIISLSGHDRGVCYPIKYGEEIIIGKNPYIANIVINKKFETVSRRHCGIKYDAVNDMYQVIDYSMNGTYINSVRQLCKGVYVNVPRGTIINLAKENLDYKLS